jgi:hypothetical protein
MWQINHGIKLYPPGAVPNSLPTEPSTTPVVAEFYDEVVFTNPSEKFFRQLQRLGSLPKVEFTHREHVPEYTDVDDFNALIEAQKFVQNELMAAKESYAQVTSDLALVDADLQKAQADAKKSASKAAVKRRAPPAKKAKTAAS